MVKKISTINNTLMKHRLYLPWGSPLSNQSPQSNLDSTWLCSWYSWCCPLV